MIKNKKKLISVFMAAAVAFTLPFNIEKVKAKAETRGSFNVLSLNVAGLPQGLSSSNPKNNTLQMSPLLNDYDIVSVQEDFAYHDDLIKYDNHQYKTDTSGNVPVGDGMNFMSKFPLYNILRCRWNKSSGFINNGADTMTPKGILYSSLEIAPGYYIDIYDIHTDAGDDEGSYEARRDNMNQLAALIKERSQGKAVIVIGDTNSRYTRSQDNFEQAVLNTCNLKDAWIELVRHNNVPSDGDALIDRNNPNSANNEVVDKIFYRNGENIDLSAVQYELLANKFVDSNGNQLSDHYPITARFNYTLKDNLQMSNTYGENNGNGFSFINECKNNFPTAVAIRADKRLDSISFKYPQKEETAGGTGGNFKFLNLKSGEYIKSMELSKDKKSTFGSYRISYIKLVTNLGNVLEGGTRSETVTLQAPDGYAISGVYGTCGDEIDSIGAIYKQLY
ncbi:MAG: jacalin-like lectin [Clostridium sp.]